MVLAVVCRVGKVLGENTLVQVLLENLYAQPIGGAIGNVCLEVSFNTSGNAEHLTN